MSIVSKKHLNIVLISLIILLLLLIPILAVAVPIEVDQSKGWHALQQVAKSDDDNASIDQAGDGIIDLSNTLALTLEGDNQKAFIGDSTNGTILNIQSGAGKYAAIDFFDGGDRKWGLGKNPDGNFYIDLGGVAGSVLTIDKDREVGIDGSLRLMPRAQPPQSQQLGSIYYDQEDNQIYAMLKQNEWLPLFPDCPGDGALSVTTGTVTINHEAIGGVSGTDGDVNLAVPSDPIAAGFSVGDTVLIIQMTADDVANAGHYETKVIDAIPSTVQVQFTEALTNTYTNDANSKAQMIRVPQYSTVNVAEGAVLTAPAWDGSKGGVLYFQATGKVTNFGTISMEGKGWSGGASVDGGRGGIVDYPNGVGGSNGLSGEGQGKGNGGLTGGAAGRVKGGGGGCCAGGGAGGGHSTAGTAGRDGEAGDGGQREQLDSVGGAGSAGAGGTPGGSAYGVENLSSQIFMGSGGGSGGSGAGGAVWIVDIDIKAIGGAGGIGGYGGNGGGIIIITAMNVDNVNGKITADGSSGGAGGNGIAAAGGGGAGAAAGGGGAGGAIFISATEVKPGATTAVGAPGSGVVGNGGNGGNTGGREGGGGAGLVGGTGTDDRNGASAAPGTGGNGGDGRTKTDTNFQPSRSRQSCNIIGGGGIDADWNILGNDMFAGVTGKVGIGTNDPQAKLDIKGDLRLTPTTPPQQPQLGTIYYDQEDNQIYAMLKQNEWLPLFPDCPGDGALSVTTGTVIINQEAIGGVSGTAGDVNLNVPSDPIASGFSVGDTVLIIQMTADDVANAGHYETKVIKAIPVKTQVQFAEPLTNTYISDANNKAQMVRVPQYSTVDVAVGATLTAPAWDGTKGGVLYFQATGKVTNFGTISMEGKGFLGGNSQDGGKGGRDNTPNGVNGNNGLPGQGPGKGNGGSIGGNYGSANSGGGGCCAGGGAGGSHSTAGTAGRNGVAGNGGEGTGGAGSVGPGGTPGGSYGSADLSSQIFMGSGGGSGGSGAGGGGLVWDGNTGGYGGVGGSGGYGGSGGGIIIITATQVDNANGKITADGSGGGAGGNGGDATNQHHRISGSLTGLSGGGGAGAAAGGGGAGGAIFISATEVNSGTTTAVGSTGNTVIGNGGLSSHGGGGAGAIGGPNAASVPPGIGGDGGEGRIIIDDNFQPSRTRQNCNIIGGGGRDADWNILGNDMFAGVSGKVGIGTNQPDQKLHIKKTEDNSVIVIDSGDGQTQKYSALDFYDNGDLKWGLGKHPNGNFYIDLVNDGNVLTIDGDKNVGIGTQQPKAKLDVAGNANINGKLDVAGTAQFGSISTESDTLVDADGSTLAGVGASASISENEGLVAVKSTDNLCANSLTAPTAVRIDANSDCTDNSGTDGNYIIGTSATAATTAVTSAWAFQDADADATYNDGEDIYIDSFPKERFNTGKVGIGTQQPQAKLDINGDLRLTPTTPPQQPQLGSIYYDQADNQIYAMLQQGEWIPLFPDCPGDGALSVTTGTVTINQEAIGGVSGTDGDVNLAVPSDPIVAGFSVGDTVLIIQMTGTDAGIFEIRVIDDIPSLVQVHFREPLINTYTNNANSKAQMIKVPQYSTVDVAAGATLTAPDWDGTKGGVLYFEATGKVTNFGTISMEGKGFGGGAVIEGGSGGYYRKEAETGRNGNNGLGLGGGNGGSTGGESVMTTTSFNVMGKYVGGAGGTSGGGAGGSYGTRGENGDAGAAGNGGNAVSKPGPTGEGSSGAGGTVASTYGTDILSSQIFMGSGGGSGGSGAGGGSSCSTTGGCAASFPSGGSGGTGGAGGVGGGIIIIHASEINNNNNNAVISVRGTNGMNGGDGQAGQDDQTKSAFAGGGGGAGGAGGGGGAGGSIWFNAQNLQQGMLQVDGGTAGIGGNGGNGGNGVTTEGSIIRAGGGAGTTGGLDGGANASPGTGGDGGEGIIKIDDNFQPTRTRQSCNIIGGGGIDADWNILGNDMFAGVTGKVGIGTNDPQAKLDINGDLRLTPTTPPQQPQLGTIYYDQADNKIYAMLQQGEWAPLFPDCPGDGAGAGDGALSVTTETVINHQAIGGVSGNVDDTYLAVPFDAKAAGFSAGDTVLIIQMTGTGAGKFEKKIIKAIPSDIQVEFTESKLYTYTNDADSKAQMIRVPQYASVDIAAEAVLTAPDWDGTKGGILIFDVQGGVTNKGTIMAPKGFKGGPNAVGCSGVPSDGTGPGGGTKGGMGGATGGDDQIGRMGGGAGGSSGGGSGGSHGEMGSNGVNGVSGNGGKSGEDSQQQASARGGSGSVGIGGTAPGIYGEEDLSAQIFMGSGGGTGSPGRCGGIGQKFTSNPGPGGEGGTGGAGGAGGGIIIIHAAALDNTNIISADGGGSSDGGDGYRSRSGSGGGGGGAGGAAGGGGSGGAIWLKVGNVVRRGSIQAAGGLGSTIVGNGGQGGGGGGAGKTGGPAGANPGAEPGANAAPGVGGKGGDGRIKLDNVQPDIKKHCPLGGGGGGSINVGWTRAGNDAITTVSGNVGIGANQPSKKLHIKKTDDDSVIVVDSGDGVTPKYSALDFYDNGDLKWGLGKHPNGNFYIDLGRVGNALTIDNDMEIGIGTDDPKAKLDVAGNANINGKLDVAGTAQFGSIYTESDTLVDADGSTLAGVGASASISENDALVAVESGDTLCTNSLTAPTVVFIDAETLDCTTDADPTETAILGTVAASTTYTAVTSAWAFQDANADATYNNGEDIYIDNFPKERFNTGNVGIGTQQPQAKLDVAGSLSLRGIGAPSVSTAGQGTIYFDSTANKFMVSENEGEYEGLVGGGGGGGGGSVQRAMFTTPDTYTWTAPAGVTKVWVTGSGGGGGAFYSGGGGGGGADAVMVRELTVTPGTAYTITVGDGAAGTNSRSPADGGASSFGDLLTIPGGGSAYGANGGAAGGPGGASGDSTGAYLYISGGDSMFGAGGNQRSGSLYGGGDGYTIGPGGKGGSGFILVEWAEPGGGGGGGGYTYIKNASCTGNSCIATATCDSGGKIVYAFSRGQRHRCYIPISFFDGMDTLRHDCIEQTSCSENELYNSQSPHLYTADKACVLIACSTVGGSGGGKDADWTILGNDMFAGVSGNVGIGTDIPSKKLHIKKTDDNAVLVVDSGDGTTGKYSALDFYDNGNLKWGLGKHPNGNFYIDLGGVGNALTIDGDGEVGIGTDNPQATLEVDNAVRITPSQTAPFACSAAKTGSLYFDGTSLRLCSGNIWSVFVFEPDPPIRRNPSPTTQLAAGTTQADISLATDVSPICKYSATAGTAYDSMTAMSITGSTTHSHTITGLTNGNTYTYYVKCRGPSNTNRNDFTIQFSVAETP